MILFWGLNRTKLNDGKVKILTNASNGHSVSGQFINLTTRHWKEWFQTAQNWMFYFIPIVNTSNLKPRTNYNSLKKKKKK